MSWVRTAIVILALVPCVLAGVVLLLAAATVDHIAQPQAVVDTLDDTATFERLEVELGPRMLETTLQERAPELPPSVVDEAGSLTRSVLSEAWFDHHLTPLLTGTLDWATGRRPQLPSVDISLTDRVAAAADTLASRWVGSATAHWVHERALVQVARAVETANVSLPLGLTVSPAAWREALELALGQDWFEAVTADAITSLGAWLSGARSDLVLHIPLQQRQAEVAEAVRLLIASSDLAGFVEQTLLSPETIDRIEAELQLPQSVSVSRDELVGALREVVTPEWLHQLEEQIATVVGDYLAGRSARLELEVSLVDLKARAVDVLTPRVDQRLKAAYDALPMCSRRDMRKAMSGGMTTMRCRPGHLQYDAASRLAGFDTARVVRSHLEPAIPDTFVYDEARIQERVGEATWQRVERMRGVMQQGIVLTDDDLRALACPERYAADEATRERALENADDIPDTCRVDTVRARIAAGVQLGGAALHLRLDEAAPDTLDHLELTRSVLRNVRELRSLILVAIALCLVLIAVVAPLRGPWCWTLPGLVLALIAAGLLVALQVTPDGLTAPDPGDASTAAGIARDWFTQLAVHLGEHVLEDAQTTLTRWLRTLFATAILAAALPPLSASPTSPPGRGGA